MNGLDTNMPVSPAVARYRAARARQDALAAELRAIGAELGRLGRALTAEPGRIVFVNCPSFAAPRTVALSCESDDFDAGALPDLASLPERVMAYQAALAEARAALRALSPEERAAWLAGRGGDRA